MPEPQEARPGAPQRHATVDVDGLSKTFRIPRQHVLTLKERALHPFRRVEIDELHALRDVSFQILEGEFFGIVGRNGSGKSTLLKCLADIYRADRGRIRIAGRVAPFIELGVGFNPELTAHENVVINGVMMGLTPREARARFADIIDFAELGDFLELKLKNYSSGMQVRLAFALMVQSDAEILLIDEVLAVGDVAFQQKCFEAFDRLHEEGRTIILVTHDMHTVERFCDRALLLAEGSIDVVGDPEAVAHRYLQLNFQRGDNAGATRAALIEDVWISDGSGDRCDTIEHGERMAINAIVRAREPIEEPALHAWVSNADGAQVFGASSLQDIALAPPLKPGESMQLRIGVTNRLASGRFHLGCALDSGPGATNVAFNPRFGEFTVTGADRVGGMVALEADVEVVRDAVEVRP
ncbi:MAG TPA: ABC transporter ATP-binding protein [Solirubrobacteraceae bacterium]